MSAHDRLAYRALLAKALAEAKRAAAKAAEASDDGGTCNLDSAVLRPPKGMPGRVIEEAAAEAGVRVSATTWCGRGYFLHFVTNGQANKNERGVRAAITCLEEHGLRVSYYAQMD